MQRLKDGHFQKKDGLLRKKSRTRALILDTSIEIFADKGIEAASIVEITARAGIANGSFYYHFKDKTELVDAVGGAVAATLIREVDDAMHDVSAGVDRVAMGTMLVIKRGVADPIWGRLIVHALAELGEFRDQISVGIRNDVRIGIEQKQFDAPLPPAMPALLLGIVASAMRERLDRPHLSGVGSLAARSILCILGIPAREAEEIVKRSLARIRLSEAGKHSPVVIPSLASPQPTTGRHKAKGAAPARRKPASVST